MTVLRLADGSAGWLPAGWPAGSGGAAFIRIAVTVFCAARLNASVTRTAPRSEASRWPTATPTPYSRPRATISTPHRTTVSTDPWRHKVPSASRHTLMVWPHTPSPATAPRSPRAARDRRAPARSRQAGCGFRRRPGPAGASTSSRGLIPRYLYLPGQHPGHGRAGRWQGGRRCAVAWLSSTAGLRGGGLGAYPLMKLSRSVLKVSL
jgi:hypothetical protein